MEPTSPDMPGATAWSSSRPLTRHRVGFLFTGLMVASMVVVLPSSASAGDGYASDDHEVHPAPGHEVNLMQDAEAYAIDYGVSVEESLRRLNLQDDLHQVLAEIRNASPTRFAGGWIEHKPEFGLVVRLTGAEPADEAVRTVLGVAPAPVRVEYQARQTEAELIVALGRVDRALAENWPATSRGIDIRSGSIVLTGPHLVPGSLIDVLQRETGVPLRAERGGSYEPNHTYGGAMVDFNGTPWCTTGFTIRQKNTLVRGVITAGHCPDTLRYHQPDAAVQYNLTLFGQRADDHKDAQWLVRDDHVVVDDFWDGDSFRDQEAAVARLDMTGDFVCHWGITTGFSCGTIQMIHFDPGDRCGYSGNQPCAATWVQVQGPNLACFFGDSGGPWFSGSMMYGTHTHGFTWGTERGECGGATLMSLGFLSEMTLEALTAG